VPWLDGNHGCHAMLLEIRPLHHTGQLGDDGVSLILAYLSDLSISLSAELTMQQLHVCFVVYSYYIAEREREVGPT
jgi:hypothetical protein